METHKVSYPFSIPVERLMKLKGMILKIRKEQMMYLKIRKAHRKDIFSIH